MCSRNLLTTRNLLAGALLLLTAGCLSLGGKTTYVQESADTPNRLSSLEARVSALEQTLSSDPSPTAAPTTFP
jgi:hypothetical protein